MSTRKIKTMTITEDERFLPKFDMNSCIGQRIEENGLIRIKRVGRPSEYKQEFCQQMLDFFNVRPYEKKIKIDAQDNQIEYEVANDMPTFSSFCLHVGIAKDTFYKWVKKIPEFSDAYGICKEIQKEFLCVNALRNNFNSQFSKFWAINNTDMKDNVLELENEDGDKLQIKVINYYQENKKNDEDKQK